MGPLLWAAWGTRVVGAREGRADPLNFSWSGVEKGGHACEGVFMLNPAPVPLRLPESLAPGVRTHS